MARFSFIIISCIAILSVNVHSQSADTVQVLTQFERLYVSNQTTPPVRDQNGWQQVVLKDLWPLRRRIQHQEAWYHTTFNYPTNAQENYAVFIPRVAANVSIWVNGTEIGNTGSFSEPLLRNWNHPVYFPLPKNQLQSGSNTLDIRLKVNLRRTGMLYEVNIGPAATLNPIYQRSYFAKVTASKILSSVLLISVIILLTFYFTTNLPKGYFWFALGTATWTIFSLTFFVRYPWINEDLWDATRMTALNASLIFYALTIHAIFSINRPVVIRFLVAMLCMYVFCALLLPTALKSLVTYLYLYFAQFVLVLMAGSLCWRVFSKKQSNRGLLLFTGISVIAIIVYDWLLAIFDITAQFAKYPYLPVVILISGTTAFMRRLIQHEREHATLDIQKAEIENSARSEALKSERQRLMQEIHDGVGGQLVSTLARLERNRTVDTGVVETLRTSIDDLRLIVHSLDSLTQYGDVVTLLATIRERMEKNLRQQGLHMNWQVQAVPPVEDFSSEQALQLLRIVQEAITNIIKHADATIISLRCYPDDKAYGPGITIQIHDNGKGFDPSKQSVGLGLKNMRERATKLHGQFSIQSDNSGTSLELWIPLHAQTLAQAAN